MTTTKLRRVIISNATLQQLARHAEAARAARIMIELAAQQDIRAAYFHEADDAEWRDLMDMRHIET